MFTYIEKRSVKKGLCSNMHWESGPKMGERVHVQQVNHPCVNVARGVLAEFPMHIERAVALWWGTQAVCAGGVWLRSYVKSRTPNQ